MQKLLKRITLVLAAAFAVVCLGVFATACTDDDNQTYTITVQYADGTPVDGTKTNMNVQICLWIEATQKVGSCFGGNFNVGADGKATVPVDETGWGELEKNTQYHIQVNNVPEGYTYEEHGYIVKTPQNVTITLVEKTEA